MIATVLQQIERLYVTRHVGWLTVVDESGKEERESTHQHVVHVDVKALCLVSIKPNTRKRPIVTAV